jgi:adenosine deaminase
VNEKYVERVTRRAYIWMGETGLLKSFPKVLLHEHLDGVLRPKTVVELAKSAKYAQLPTEDPEELARWFHQGANQGERPVYNAYTSFTGKNHR